jgi:hypothetical protein
VGGGSRGGGSIFLGKLDGGVATHSSSGETYGTVLEKGAAGLELIMKGHRVWIVRVTGLRA